MNMNRLWADVVDGIDERYITEASNVIYKSVMRERPAIEVDFAKVQSVPVTEPPKSEKIQGFLYAAAAVAVIIGACFLLKFIFDTQGVQVDRPGSVTQPQGTNTTPLDHETERFIPCETVIDDLTAPDGSTLYAHSEISFTMPEFEGVDFQYNGYCVKADDKVIISGLPIWNIFFADVTGDGTRDICATASFGSGIIDERVYVYDYSGGALYELSNRGMRDFVFAERDGGLYVHEYSYPVNSFTGDSCSEYAPDMSTFTLVRKLEVADGGRLLGEDELLYYEDAMDIMVRVEALSEREDFSFIKELPYDAQFALAKAWLIAEDMTVTTRMMPYSTGAPDARLTQYGKIYHQTNIRYSSFVDYLYDVFTPEAANEMLSAFPYFTGYNYGLWVEEVIGSGVDFIHRSYTVLENTDDRIDILRTRYSLRDGLSGVDENGFIGYDASNPEQYAKDYTHYVLVKDSDGHWKAELFLHETPYGYEDSEYKALAQTTVNYKLICGGRAYWVRDTKPDAYDYITGYVEGKRRSIKTGEVSEFDKLLTSSPDEHYNMGETINVGSGELITMDNMTDYPLKAEVYSDRKSGGDTVILLTETTYEDYQLFKAKYNPDINEPYFRTDIKKVVVCEKVPDDELFLFFGNESYIEATGTPLSPESLEDFDIKNAYSRYVDDTVYGYKALGGEDTRGVYNIGKFLNELDMPEVTDAYFKAACLLTMFDDEHLPDFNEAELPAKLLVREIGDDCYSLFVETGYTYESFFKVLTDTFTENTAYKLIQRVPYFREYNGGLWRSAYDGIGVNTAIYYDYELVEKTEDSVTFCEIDYLPADWRTYTPGMTFDPMHPENYTTQITIFKFVKDEKGWRAEEFNNINNDDKPIVATRS